ncbi:MAG: multicopper oxidase domain-containing protein [Deltaproteobacteria bacterium]|nr:multicopper oxidase domain-containing protein [Deltaproteobacteria bacterium]
MRRTANMRRMKSFLSIAIAIVLLSVNGPGAEAVVDGITGTAFNLTAREDFISTADGGSVLIWGYDDGSGRAQYPGPTLIVDQGVAVTITLTNALPASAGNASIVIPGQQVSSSGGTAGRLTREAVPGGTVMYTFTPARPGTFLYHSGTLTEIQEEMGMAGAIIVRPAGFNPAAPTAYGHADSAYDREYLFILSEMDSRIHDVVEFLGPDALGWFDFLSSPYPNYYFINGRTAVDTMSMSNSPGTGLYPTQPYGAMAVMHPGDRVLLRVVGIGRGSHPFHLHGNHARVIAKDGRMLESAPGAGPDLSTEIFTILSSPGQTTDSIFEWTGKGMGWDIYGADAGHEHPCNGMTVAQAQALRASNPNDAYFGSQDPATKEWCADHGNEIPVTLPNSLDLTMGPFFSASPYLGRTEDPLALPVGQQNFNGYGAYIFMWHSHNEKELLNYGVFPGGMLTMMAILPQSVPLD